VADNLTDTAEDRALNWLTQNTTTAPSGALKCRLMTANGSDSAAGTEVAGGSYTSQTVTFSASSGGATSNSSDLTFSGMPACTVVGVEIWDSAGSPVRWWWGALSASKTVNSGDTFVIPTGDLDLSLG
jgi:hypothetical protein